MIHGQSCNIRSDKVMSATEAAYLAGFVDGEGTITLGRAKRSENRAGFRYQPSFSFAQSRRSALQRIIRLCGNGRLIASRPPDGPHQKQGYRVQFQPNQIRHVLPQIAPYLIVKYWQAKVLLKALDLLQVGDNYTPDRWVAIQQYRYQLQSLNRRGQGRPAPFQAIELPSKRATGVKGRPATRHGCLVEGCLRRHEAKGYCKRHYKQLVQRRYATVS